MSYYPFGMLMPGRSVSSANGYRYGFNGKENDNEVKGEGVQLDYGMRVYDARLGRFLSVDPLQQDYPELTPYQFASNTPIQAIDLDGLENFHYTLIRNDKGKPTLHFDRVENFTETKTKWTPTLTDWTKTTTTTVTNPRAEYIVHGTAPVTYGLDGNATSTDNFSWTFDSQSDMQSAESHGGPSNYGGWNWSNSDQAGGTGLFIGVFNAIQAEGETPGGLAGLGSKFSKASTPAAKTNNTATSAHGGNTGSASANNAAKPTITYEGQTYEVKANVPYKRPNNATVPAQRAAANQTNSSCATCGTTKGPFVADHKTPLAIEHISTGTIDKKKMRSLEATQSQCQGCSNTQSQNARKASQAANKIINRQNGN